MLFNSVIFITIFLPLALFGWFMLQKLENPAFAKAFLVGMSLWFYGYYNVYYLWILVVSMAANFCLSILFEKFPGAKGQKCLLVVGVGGNLGLLFYFKYFNFFVDNCNFFLHTDIRIEKIALPLGISFFTFQQLSFVVERYRKNAAHYPFLDYAFFVSFFPQLIAGPIVLHQELIPRLQERKNRSFSVEGFYDGAALFILGLAKKVLLADSLAVLVSAEYSNIAMLDTPSAWAVVCWFTMELYFDFSGYSDMARGIAGMFGFALPENFNSPFRAASVREFWRRWHITLTRFLTQYVYYPLGGNRKGRARKCLNLMAVFLLSGLWHGASWTYIVWGLMHGAAVVFETLFPKARFRHEWMNRLAVTVFFILSVSVFWSDSLEMTGLLWQKLFTAGNRGMLPGVCNMLQLPENYAVLKFLERTAPGMLNPFFIFCFLLLTAVGVLLLRGDKAEVWIAKKGHSWQGAFVLATLFFWSFISLSQVSVFLYFNF